MPRKNTPKSLDFVTLSQARMNQCSGETQRSVSGNITYKNVPGNSKKVLVFPSIILEIAGYSKLHLVRYTLVH